MADSYPWQDRARERLDSIAQLERGWDSYGADPIDPRAIATARQFIGALSVISVGITGLVQPGGIVPNGHRGVELEWNTVNGAWINVEFTPDGGVRALSRSTDGEEAEFGYPDDVDGKCSKGDRINPDAHPGATAGDEGR